MKKSLLAVIILLVACSSAQMMDQKEIKTALKDYYTLIRAKEYSKVLDYMHPKLFEIAPREMIQKSLESIDADPEVSITFKDEKITKISETLVHENIKYLLVDYNFQMDMQLHFDKENSKEDNIETLEMTFETLKIMHDEKDMILDKENFIIKITSYNQMYAIRSEEFNSWKFLENKEGMDIILNQIIPKEVQEQLLLED